MKVFFDGQVSTHFTVYKLTLKPGENVIHDEKVAHALLEAHASDCKRGTHKVPVEGKPGHFTTAEDKPRLRKIEDKKAEPAKMVTSAPSSKSTDAKKGAK